MKIRIFFLIAIVAFAVTGAALFVNASHDNRENCELSNEVADATTKTSSVK